jgi:type VI secretion system secreted protein VgrG
VVVVGPPEAKGIHVDKWGRIRVQFYWDRREKDANNQPIKPDNRSCWVRVSQAWADAGFGTMMIPRVGQEVLVDFVDGDPDQPIVVGRVYNNDAMPPHPLPGSKTKSTWKSQTVGDAGSYSQTEEPPPASDKGFNEIGFEDKGGSEQIFIHAQRDMVTWIRHDESWKVGHNVKMRVGYNRETQIKNHETLIIEQGDETHTVKAGSRKTTINKADELKVETGDKKLEVSSGNWANAIKMGNVTVKADVGKIEMEAMQSIELKVGQSSIKIDQMGVTVKGPMIKVNASMMLEAKAGAMGTLDGGGMLTVKGGLVMIN